jgi:hypothetical protein
VNLFGWSYLPVCCLSGSDFCSCRWFLSFGAGSDSRSWSSSAEVLFLPPPVLFSSNLDFDFKIASVSPSVGSRFFFVVDVRFGLRRFPSHQERAPTLGFLQLISCSIRPPLQLSSAMIFCSVTLVRSLFESRRSSFLPKAHSCHRSERWLVPPRILFFCLQLFSSCAERHQSQGPFH